MERPVKSPQEALQLIARVWSRTGGFFTSIEVWLMVLVAALTVGGLFLAFMGDGRSLLAFGIAAGYLAARPLLHARGILRWPFL